MEEFPNRDPPDRKTRYGTSLNRHKGNSGRPKSGRRVKKYKFHRIVKNDLNWHPYRIKIRNNSLKLAIILEECDSASGF